MKIYVQFGCGLTAPKDWINFDASPTLKIQKIPLFGKLVRRFHSVKFPDNVLYGDIIKGLPLKQDSVDYLFCSHTLEHLSLSDFRVALKNSYSLLKYGGSFRVIVPSLRNCAERYLEGLNTDSRGSIKFMEETMLGVVDRPRGIMGILKSYYGNSHHLWMWDELSLKREMADVGFKNIVECSFHDINDPIYNQVEDRGRYLDAVCLIGYK